MHVVPCVVGQLVVVCRYDVCQNLEGDLRFFHYLGTHLQTYCVYGW